MFMVRAAVFAMACAGIVLSGAQGQQEVAGWQVNCDEGPIPDAGEGCFLTKAASNSDTASLIVVMTDFFDEARGQLWLGVSDVAAFGTAGLSTIALDDESYEIPAATNAHGDYSGDAPTSYTVVDFRLTPDFVSRLRDGVTFSFSVTLAEPEMIVEGEVSLDGLREAWSTAAESQGWTP